MFLVCFQRIFLINFISYVEYLSEPQWAMMLAFIRIWFVCKTYTVLLYVYHMSGKIKLYIYIYIYNPVHLCSGFEQEVTCESNCTCHIFCSSWTKEHVWMFWHLFNVAYICNRLSILYLIWNSNGVKLYRCNAKEQLWLALGWFQSTIYHG